MPCSCGKVIKRKVTGTGIQEATTATEVCNFFNCIVAPDSARVKVDPNHDQFPTVRYSLLLQYYWRDKVEFQQSHIRTTKVLPPFGEKKIVSPLNTHVVE